MQGSASWTQPGGTLGRIVAEAGERVALLRERRQELDRLAADRPRDTSRATLRDALVRPTVQVIAEVKRKSPSKGWIREGIGAASQAAAYEAGGAAAISVLTEPAHFQGSIDDLVAVLDAVRIPILKKDFHVDEVQLVEARAVGATAALLIARALAPGRLEALLALAHDLDLEVLVEVRDRAELDRALAAGSTIVGVNNRDLETLEIDPATIERVLPHIPAGVVAIAESGVRTIDDVRRAAKVGARAVLVGSSISAADDPGAAVRSLTGVPIAGDGA